MLHRTRTFEEKRKRSRSAGPSRQFRKTDIFFNADQIDSANASDSSEYKKCFLWPKQLDSLDEDNLNVRLNPNQKSHPAGLSSRRCGANNKAHVIQNSNGSTSIVIANEPTDYAITTGSTTNLVSLTNPITFKDSIRPLTSMALTDSDLNKSLSSNGSAKLNGNVNKSITLTNLADYSIDSLKQDLIKSQKQSKSNKLSKQTKDTQEFNIINNQLKDTNNNVAPSAKPNGAFNEELLLEKLSKLNTYESIYGKKAGAGTLFNREEMIDLNTINEIPKQSEYKSKFKSFNSWVCN